MSILARIITTSAIVTLTSLSVVIFPGVDSVSAQTERPDRATDLNKFNRDRERREDTDDRRENREDRDHREDERTRDKRSSDQRSESQQLKRCQQRLEKIELVTEDIETQATRHMAVFDRIHNRVQTFYDTSPLTDPDYNDLNAEVVTASEATTTELELFVSSTADITCTGEQPLRNPTKEIRTRAKAVIESLHVYRSTLVLLIQSLRVEIADSQAPPQPEASTEDDQPTNQPTTE